MTNMKKTYSSKELNESNIDLNPVKQFSTWLNEAIAAEVIEPTAMALSTASKKGIPSARIVLLKGIDEKGIVFFTNYESAKAKNLFENPNAEALFHWKELGRQVRVSGIVKKVSKKESKEYFKTRPRESQLGAWVSKQSSEIPSREYLEKKFEDAKQKFKGKEIPLPPFWGGFRIIPNNFEFWQGRENRLHDRICYKKKDGEWKIIRLSP